MRFRNLSEYFNQDNDGTNTMQNMETYERFLKTSGHFYTILTSEGIPSRYAKQLDKPFVNSKYVEKFDAMIKSFEGKNRLKHLPTRNINPKQLVSEKIYITYSQSIDIVKDYEVSERTGQFTGFFRDYLNIINTSIIALKKNFYLEVLTYLENVYSISTVEESLAKGAELYLFEIDNYLHLEDFTSPETFLNINFTEESVEFYDEETGAQEKELCFCTNLHMDFFINQA